MGDRYDGDGRESSACIDGCAATVFTGRGSQGDKKYNREGDISAVSAGEGRVMGRGVLGRWVLCSDSGE